MFLAILPLKIFFLCNIEKNYPEQMIWSCQISSFNQKYNIEPFTKIATSLKIMRFFCFQVYNLESVGFCSVILNRYMLKISDVSE